MKRTASEAGHPAERQADAIGARIGGSLASVSSFGPGPLPAHARSVAEPHLGVSLAGTQLRADRGAQRKAASESALAVTEGGMVSFAAGQFSSSTSAGRALIGHELTHVGQQATHARAVQLRVEPSFEAPGIAPASSSCTEEAKCPPGHDPESRYAAKFGGKVFVGATGVNATNEAILWNFCVDSARPRHAHASALRNMAKKWKKLMSGDLGLRVRVVGGTSASGAGKGNDLLGLARATCVKELLVGDGLDARRIDATTSGARHPLAPNDTPENMARNRRVEFGLYTRVTVAPSVPWVGAWGVAGTPQIGELPLPKPGTSPWLTQKRPPPPVTSNVSARFEPKWDDRENYAGVGTHSVGYAVADVTIASPVDAPILAGFLQLIVADTWRGRYREPGGAELVLDYSHCMGRDLPCRDVFSSEDVLVRAHQHKPYYRTLTLSKPGMKSGWVAYRDSPGMLVPIKYPKRSGPFFLERLHWQYKFAVLLAVFDVPLRALIVLSHARWEVIDVEDFSNVRKGKTGRLTATRSIVSRNVKHTGFSPGQPSHLDISHAMSGPTCRINARAIDVAPTGPAPCEPVVRPP